MKHGAVVNRRSGQVLGERVALADRWWPRLAGLLGRSRLPTGHGMLFRPCRGLHTFGMSFTLDAVFLDHDGRVIALYPELRPWRRTRLHWRAACAIELPAGTLRATDTRERDRLDWVTHDEEADGPHD